MKPYYSEPGVTLYCGDAREVLPQLDAETVNCCVTSPPFWGLRDYGTATWDGGNPDCKHKQGRPGAGRADGIVDDRAQRNRDGAGAMGGDCKACGARRIDAQLGLEPTPEEYTARMVEVFREVWRVLRDDGTLWLNLGDSYAANGVSHLSLKGASSTLVGTANVAHAGQFKHVPAGLKPKDLVGIPWRVAFALQADGWYLRSDIIWCLSGGVRVYARTQKGDMPMSVKDVVRLDPATVKLWNATKWTQVLGWSRSPEPRDGALEIELRSGERIGCTPGHEWPTERGNVRTDALVPGDVIRTVTLPEPDVLTTAEALDADVAWFCGMYLAEGSMSGETVQLAGHANQTKERITRLEAMARRFHGTIRAHVHGENSASICMDGPIVAALIRAYVHGDSAATKGLEPRTWQRDNTFLRALLEGYLAGDGSYDAANNRWRLGFTRNDRLAADLRTLAARLGLSMRLAPSTVTGFGREWPAYRGDIRLERTAHHNARQDGEVVSIHPGKGRKFWDIGVEDEPHLFALASGVLTHNSKPNPMPESVTDRCTKSHEYLFMLAKSERYFFNAGAIAERATCYERQRTSGIQPPKVRALQVNGTHGKGGDLSINYERETRNKRDVWTIATEPYPEAHFATFPPALVMPCLLAGCPVAGTVLEPFAGSGTVLALCKKLGLRCIGIELNREYCELAVERLRQDSLDLQEVPA